MWSKSPITAEINATIKNVIPDHSKLPVKKYTSIAANAAMGKANRNPIKTMAIKPIISKTKSSHQKLGSEGLKTCSANKNEHSLNNV
jgi:hypothetical protein